MSVRVTGLKETLDPWLESCEDADRRAIVIEAIASAADTYDELFSQAAPVGDHPLARWIDVESGGVTLRVMLTRPNRGIHLLDIFDYF